MNTSNARLAVRTFGAVLLGVAAACATTLSYAQPGGGAHIGGGDSGPHSGGGHFGGGSGHTGGGSTGAAHFAGGGAPSHGFGGAPYAVPHSAAGGYAAHGLQAPRGFQGAHGFQPPQGFHAAHGGFVPRPGSSGGHAVAVASSGGRYSAGYHGGYYGGRYWGGAHYWGGGYWGGSFWPHCYFYPGFAWYLPLLPFGYATYWWSGVPYYYYNSLYYTWNPGYSGYVVTDPPPAAGGDSNDTTGDASQYSGADASQYGDAAPLAGGVAQNGGSADVYVYPRNGQNDQQTSNDRYECHSWAVNQTGFDPTRATQQSGSSADYRRAIIACLDARGYTAR